jgi:thiamine pyrophosphokinase
LAQMISLIFSGGTCRDVEFYRGFIKDAGLIIAADGGGEILAALNAVPHVLIGDMDSIGPDTAASLKDRGVEVIEAEPEKDFTDTELAVRLAVDRGATDITILAAIGTRLDHTLANVSLLLFAHDRGIRARIVNEDQQAYLLTADVTNPIAGKIGDTVSLIALSDPVTGVTTHDLKYPLKEAELKLLSPLGVSNEISGKNPCVEFREGRLLLIKVRCP